MEGLPGSVALSGIQGAFLTKSMITLMIALISWRTDEDSRQKGVLGLGGSVETKTIPALPALPAIYNVYSCSSLPA